MSGDPGSNHVALWAGITACLSNLAAVSVIDILGGPDTANLIIAAFVTSAIVGGVMYSRQRLEDEKAARRRRARERKMSDEHRR